MKPLADWMTATTGRRMLVIGDLMLDKYVWGEAERVSPEAPVLVLREDFQEVRPGGAANVASFLRGLEAEVQLAGIVGDDPEGRTLLRLMSDLRVETSLVLTDPDRPTTAKQRIVGRTAQRQPHQMVRIDRESRTPLAAELLQDLTASILSVIPSFDAVLISDYGKGICAPALMQAVIAASRCEAIPVLIDPARGVDYERYARATVITPNRTATEQVIGQPLRDPETIRSAARQLQQRWNLDAAVLTLDRDGLAFATATDTGLLPCRPREVCDVTGAGDMVLAILGLCQAAQIPLIESLPLANAAAGLEVERFGVEPLSRAEIAAELDRDQSHLSAVSGKLLTLDEMARRAACQRQAGRTVVFTNGCFDLLHIGHVSLLEAAARQGDILIVAINSDASVRQLKGIERPIISQSDRARMLGALACVDHVLIFDDDTPHRLLTAIRPDVLVKGGTTDHIVGREIVEAYGGLIVQTNTVPGLSTTALVARVQMPQSPIAIMETR